MRSPGPPGRAGSATRRLERGRLAAVRNADEMLSPTVENSTDRKTAVPSVPPICRKNSDDDVATPMSRTGTAFCTASTSGCIVKPSPSPNRTEQAKMNCSVVSVWRRENISEPLAMSIVPTTGNAL